MFGLEIESMLLLVGYALFLLGAYIVIKILVLRDNRHLNKIIETQEEIGRAPYNLEETLQLIVERLQAITGATGAVVELLDGNELYYRATSGAIKSHKGYRMKAAGSLSGYCITTGEVVYCADTEKDPRVNKEATRAIKIRSMVVAPLVHEAKIIGVLKVAAPKPKAFSKKDAMTVKLLSSLIGPAIAHDQDYDANQKLLKERSHMALHDGLTGLPNRRLFMEILGLAILRVSRSRKPMALMYLDLDGFKKINDKYGHQAGDDVLEQFGRRLKMAVRETDFVARLGGDEFTIILENLSDAKKDLKIIADKIIAAMADPFRSGSHMMLITTSIGIAIARTNERKVDELIKDADDLLYKAKEQGKNQYFIEKF